MKDRFKKSSKVKLDYKIESWLIYEKKMREIEEVEYKGGQSEICSAFGCNKILSLSERLCGRHCIRCSGKVKFDITKVMKFK